MQQNRRGVNKAFYCSMERVWDEYWMEFDTKYKQKGIWGRRENVD